MNSQLNNTVLPHWLGNWERFWFTPMDPTALGLIRILCGGIVLYTFAIYCFCLPDMMGPHAWVDLKLRGQYLHDRPIVTGPLEGSKPLARPKNAKQAEYLAKYRKLFPNLDPRAFNLPLPETEGQWDYLVSYTESFKQPPPAYAESAGEAKEVADFIHHFYDRRNVIVDPRIGGLPLPTNDWERKYLYEYTERWIVPPPAYAKNVEEAQEIQKYMEQEGIDPRLTYARGTPAWSIWMHLTDERWMAFAQGASVLVALLFTLGLGTRVTAPLTWLAQLFYLHRNPQVMFGADTMINILLLYLTIGPSGAALSLDRLLALRWRGLATPLMPRVTANLAIRLLQIHLCIIYFIAGIAKLQGVAWWNGSALWGVIANYEFAPMNFSLYTDLLRFIARDELRLQAFSTFGSYFTLTFEIGYAFMIWWPRTRRVFLGMALLLHGGIGMFMGLKTFSLIMLVMNLAFVRPDEVRALLDWFRRGVTAPPAKTALVETAVSVKA